MAVVTLLSDFGTQDGYVGAMKGVILAGAPGVVILDLTHDVPPQDVAAGAFALAQAVPYFPDGTIHVAVVDPGVGGARRGVVVDDGRQLFVGPDNGIWALAVPSPIAAYEITSPAFRRGTVAATFHGRDVFATAAARLAAGGRPSDAGPPVLLTGRLALGAGCVVHIDRFGNLITDIPAAQLGPEARVAVGALRDLRIATTFSDVGVGEPLAYVGSAGTLEIAIREGSAARVLGVLRGAIVSIS